MVNKVEEQLSKGEGRGDRKGGKDCKRGRKAQKGREGYKKLFKGRGRVRRGGRC